MTRRLCAALVVLGLLVAACTGSSGDVAAPTTAPAPTAKATVTPAHGPTTEATMTPTAVSPPAPSAYISGLPDVDSALAVAARPAPLGTYVVAKRDAGIARATVPGEPSRREIPVYDEPFGPPRSLLDVNTIDGINLPINLTNWDDPDGVLVMRVIAGGQDDDWILVQAPVRPHDGYVWVRASDFDFGYTTKRIEIDLADQGQLLVYDGDTVILRSAIVQGRETRETPTHLTYLQKGIAGDRLSPAYGEMILSIASFSEVLPTFGGGSLPSNFIHGTNQPQLMGQRVSSGEIRVPNDFLVKLADTVLPGTPVLLFDSSLLRPGRDEIFGRLLLPAATTDFLAGAAGVGDGTTGLTPELWRRCELGGSRSEIDPESTESKRDEIESDVGVPVSPVAGEPLICRNNSTPEFVTAGTDLEHVFAVAKSDAGALVLTPQEIASNQAPDPASRRVIPVFDEPSGVRRALVYTNAVDGVRIDYPLYAETVFGEPTVLSVIKMTADAQWLLVRAPVLPHDTAVWVEGKYFELDSTTLRVEVDIGYEFLGRVGILTVWDGYNELMATKISSGREHRPTTTTSTYIDQLIEGDTLGAAYGPWLFSTPSYSEHLGTFGGGGMPQQSIHGVPGLADENLGMSTSSGSIHISVEAVAQMVEIDGLVGAPVYIYDSRSLSTSQTTVRGRTLGMAETKPFYLDARDAPVGSFT